MYYTVSLLVENRFGVLARISQLISGRGFNIVSLTVAETDEPSTSRMTIVIDGDEKIMEQVKKQLNKCIDVIKVFDLTKTEPVERELMLVKVRADSKTRSQIIEIGDIFRANIVDVSPTDLTIEVTGDSKKVSALLKLLKPYGIKEVARTGKVAIARSMQN